MSRKAHHRFHQTRDGGAKSSGGPRGNRNAWQHGEYSAERKAELRTVRALLVKLRAALGGGEKHATTRETEVRDNRENRSGQQRQGEHAATMCDDSGVIPN
jgi:hypothetical protein